MENGDNMGQGMAPNQAIVNNSVVAEPEPVQEKKKVNIPAILFGITTLIFAGLAVYFGMEYFKPKSGQNGDAGNQGGNDAVVVETADMAEDYKEVYDLMKELVADLGTGFDRIQASSDIIYKPEGINLYMQMRFGLSAEIYSDDEMATVSELGTKLENDGFTSIGTIPHLGSAGPVINGYLNSDKNIMCEVYGDGTFVTQDVWRGYAFLGCAKTDWHWMTDAEKELVDKLETAYLNKTGKYPITLSGLESKIKNSQVSPYQTLQVAIGGGYALFYRVNPDAEWQYFAGGQAPLNCGDYNTEDLRKAFAGDVCYDGQTESTVQP